MKSNRVNLEVLESLIDTLDKSVEVFTTENEKIQHDFVVLSNTFRDQAYNEFQAELNAADRAMSRIIDDIRKTEQALSRYKEIFMELL